MQNSQKPRLNRAQRREAARRLELAARGRLTLTAAQIRDLMVAVRTK